MPELTYCIKSWAQFQHYKDRDPPWIKLHRNMLTSRSWLKANDVARVVQIASILLAARYENKIPLDYDVLQPAMGLRCSEMELKEAIKFLQAENFIEINAAPDTTKVVEQPASAALAKCSPEAEAEAEADTSLRSVRARLIEQFADFWQAYPQKVGKKPALAAFEKALKKHDLQTILAGILRYIEHKPDGQQWLNPATFLNQERFNDESPADIGPQLAIGHAGRGTNTNKFNPRSVVDVVNRLIAEAENVPNPGAGEWPLLSADSATDGGDQACAANVDADVGERNVSTARQNEVDDGEPRRTGDGFSGASGAVRGTSEGISGGYRSPRPNDAPEVIEVVASMGGADRAPGGTHRAPEENSEGVAAPTPAKAASEARSRPSAAINNDDGLDIPDFLVRKPKPIDDILRRTLGDGPAAKRTIGS